MVKAAGIKPDEGIRNVRSGEALSLGASVPLELRHTLLSVLGHAHQPKISLNPGLEGFLWRLLHVGVMDG